MQRRVKSAAVLMALLLFACAFGAISVHAIGDSQIAESQEESLLDEDLTEAADDESDSDEIQEDIASEPVDAPSEQAGEEGLSTEDAEPLEEPELELKSFDLTSVSVYNEADVLAALAQDGDPVGLVLMQDIELSTTLTIPADKKVSLQTPSDQDVYTMYPAARLPVMISVPSGAELSIDGPIVIDGRQTAYGYAEALIRCEGTLYLNHEKSSIQNYKSSTAVSGAVVVSKSGARFYMQEGSIQNNSVSNQYAGGGVLVHNGAYFEMNGGSIHNNLSEDANSSGGVMLYAYENGVQPADAFTSSFVMNDGQISDNVSQYGGGVFMQGASPTYSDFYSKTSFEMNGGKITNNTATGYTVNNIFRNGGGGGVYLSLNSQFTMNNGEISGNTVYGMGGGVATFDQFVSFFGKVPYTHSDVPAFYQQWPTLFPASFTMNGGTIINNRALSSSGLTGDGGCGGGVYSASKHVYLNAGLIDDNHADRQGGGVYVGSVPYAVNLNDLLLTDNTADLLGGGIWLCPTGELDFHIYRGAAVFGNQTTTAPAAGDDIAIVRNNTEIADIHLADRMLGGGLTNWNRDGGIDASALGNPTSAPRHDATAPIPMENISGTDVPSLALKATPSDTAIALAKSKAKLTISNNSSLRGGGIGTNGTIVLGDDEQPSKELTIKKVWENIPSGVQQPSSVTVYLEISGYKLDMITLSEQNNWSAKLSDLPADAVVKVVEVAVADFTTSYDWKEENNGLTLSVNVVNTYQSPSTTGELTIKKVVTGAGDQTRRFKFSVQLTDAQGQVLAGEYAYTGSHRGRISSNGIIGLSHNESITITGLPAGTNYTIVELDANKDGYRVSMQNDTGTIVAGRESVARFTNHLPSGPNPTTPRSSTRTGDTAVPLVWVSFALISMLGLIYLVLTSRKNK